MWYSLYMEEQEPLYEVSAVINGQYRPIADGLSHAQAHKIASNLFEIGICVEVKYWTE